MNLKEKGIEAVDDIQVFVDRDKNGFPEGMFPYYANVYQEKHKNYWKNPIDLNSFDLINSDFENIKTFETFFANQIYHKTFDLLVNPALKEFRLVEHTPQDAHLRDLQIIYKTSVLPQDDTELNDNGMFYRIIPLIDMFIKMRGDKETQIVATIGSKAMMVRLDDKDKFMEEAGTIEAMTWLNPKSGIMNCSDDEYEIISDMCSDLALQYLIIQALIREKPTIFTVQSKRTIHNYSNHDSKKNHRNKVKIVRTVCINKDEIKEYSHTAHHMKCPCWGVIGHWRHYKSGKRVWIAPYRKGRQRNDPATYQAKEYELPKEGNNGTDQ